MPTILFDDIIFGPIVSRRLGVSLGVNLLPTNGKICNFDCIYCECGWTDMVGKKLRFNPKEEVIKLLEEVLKGRNERGEPLDVITYAGNGEPTMHPDFEEIIDKSIELRDKYFPNVKIAVLSNATLLEREGVRRALERVDRAILKIDSAIDSTIRLIDNPQGRYSLERVVEMMKQFESEIIIQTMFLRGEYKGEVVDNTTEREVNALISLLKDINPSLVMIYSIDRDTPLDSLEKVSSEEMEAIGKQMEESGIKVSVTK